MSRIFSFYDVESSGIDPDSDQIYQTAIVKTDEDLNVIEGSTRNLMVRPRSDVVPHPKAFLTHKIDIDLLKSEGEPEFVHARRIQNEFMGNPDGTIICGYNTIPFDDEMVRKTFYRNMKNPYDHEWKDGNSRFDVFKVVQAVRAFRPEVLNWRKKEDGSLSMRLEHLSEDNGIVHENAHDAVSDVLATIEVAKMIKERRPKLWQFCMDRMDKGSNQRLLSKQRPLYHISTMHGGINANGSLVLPLIIDRQNKNKVLCLNLRHDPTPLMNMSVDEIRYYMFTKREFLPEDAPLIGIVGVQVNKQPIIMEPPTGKDGRPVYSDAVMERFNLDLGTCLDNAQKVLSNPNLQGVLTRIQMAMLNDKPPPQDAHSQLYSGGFMDPDTNRLRSSMHNKAPDGNSFVIESASIADRAATSTDAVRQYDLMLRSKWSNFYDRILNQDAPISFAELSDYVDYLEERLFKGIEGSLTVDQFNDECNMAMMEEAYSEDDKAMIQKLRGHVENELVATFKELKSIVEENKELVVSEKSQSPAYQKLEKLRERLASTQRELSGDDPGLSV